MGEGVDDLVDYSLDRGRAVQRGTARTAQFPFPDNTGGRLDLQHCAVREFQSIAPCRLHRGGLGLDALRCLVSRPGVGRITMPSSAACAITTSASSTDGANGIYEISSRTYAAFSSCGEASTRPAGSQVRAHCDTSPMIRNGHVWESNSASACSHAKA